MIFSVLIILIFPHQRIKIETALLILCGQNKVKIKKTIIAASGKEITLINCVKNFSLNGSVLMRNRIGMLKIKRNTGRMARRTVIAALSLNFSFCL